MNLRLFISVVLLLTCGLSGVEIEPSVRYDFESETVTGLRGAAKIVMDVDGGNGKAPGRVLRLVGEDSCLEVSNTKLADIRGDFTVSLWIKTPYPDGARRWSPSGQGLLAFGGGLELLYTPRRHTPPVTATFPRGAKTTVTPIDESEQYQWTAMDSIWHHVVLTYDMSGGVATMYVDGKVDKTITLSSSRAINLGGGRLIIGAVLLHGRPAGSLVGFIDDVRVYNRRLSAEQIRSMIDSSLKWIDDDPAVAATLLLKPGERARLMALEEAGVMTVRPVRLPFGSARVGRNDHLGWPIAAMVDDTIILHYHRIVAHHGRPREDADSRHTLVIRSTDGGETWSEPIDLSECGVTNKPMAFGMAAIGVLDDVVYLATANGLYKSADAGLTWQLIPGALTLEQVGPKRFGRAHNAGPRIIPHPKYGMVIPVGIERDPFMNLYHSKDRGLTWRKTQFELPSDEIHPLEPTAMFHKDRLVFVSRNHPLPFRYHHVLHDVARPCFMVSGANGWVPFEHAGVTNISSNRWPDTTALDFNPGTMRFEAVVTNRNGGVLDEETDQAQQTVNLWSIAEDDLLAGRGQTWRCDGTLIRFEHGMGDNAAGSDVDPVAGVDAAHPGGAVIDARRGVQHIFIYAGRFTGPAGIYRITRTLDTDKLRNTIQRVSK